MWIGAPFRGSLRLRFADESIAPAKHASIEFVSWPCPRAKPRPFRLGRDGKFEARFDLSTDTHWRCKDGRLLEVEIVETIVLRLAVPGCEKLDVEFWGESEPRRLEVLCPGAGAEFTHPPLPSLGRERIGAAVEFRGSSLYIWGVLTPLPAPVELLQQFLGPPAGLDAAARDAFSNDVYEWEASGVYGYARPGEPTLHTLGFLLNPAINNRHWCDAGAVQLVVNGVKVGRHTRSSKLRRAGFREAGLLWERGSGECGPS